jgi:hypothetical protein
MRLALLSILIAQLVVPASARPTPDLHWWIVSAMAKVRPGDPRPLQPTRDADLKAAQNEFEAFQIVLRSMRDAEGFDVTATDLKDGSGNTVPSRLIRIYLVGTIPVTTPSRRRGEVGEWPDPLLPRVDAFFNERRKVFPFSIAQSRTQTVWVEVYVPGGTRAGIYEGAVKVARSDSPLFEVPVRLTVWDFQLPSTSSFVTSFGFNGLSALRQHTGGYGSDDDLREISDVYSKAALWHRISLHSGGTLIPPPFMYDKDGLQVQWDDYENELGPFLDGTVFGASDPLPGARFTSVELRTHGSADTNEERILYWREWARHFREKGRLDRLFYYVKDEPAVADYPEIVRLAALAHEADPGIRTLVTIQRSRELAGSVDIWTPLINCFEARPGFDSFCRETVPRSAYEADLRSNRRLWWYQSCGSHGCNIVGGAYFKGWPSYMIDDTSISNRMMPWLAWKYRVSGELYFNVNEAYHQPGDPWDGVHLFGGNGDGTLFYPGRVERIGGTQDIPIESLRLKLIREGLEDYEYMVLLGQSADPHVARIAGGLFAFESDPEKLYAARARMAEQILKRTAGRGAKP